MNGAKIPKTIHYCWLSGGNMPDQTLKCIDSWKERMPDYSLVLWDTNRFDIDSHVFVKEACRVRKWAFASDYIRLYALYTEGGVYLDTDVYVRRSFDDFLGHGFFTAVEYHEAHTKKGLRLLNGDGTLKDRGAGIFTHGIQLQAAIMGAAKGHPFVKSCMERYDGRHFILEDGAFADKVLSPHIYADAAVGYGFRYKNELQKLEPDMVIYPDTVFPSARSHEVDGSYAVHFCSGNWRGFRYRVSTWLRHNNFLRMLLGKKKIGKAT